jgi:gamma-butyrobetaine dioxygenase
MSREDLDAVAEMFNGGGMQMYLGEEVTLAQHMLQAGALAQAAGAPDNLVAAALLHDVGHILHTPGSGDQHADNGAAWLASHGLNDSVTGPVRLHVEAKRYLCAIDPAYFKRLSDASRQSLEWQGGPMSTEEAQEFERLPHAEGAVAVRRWDEAAKDPAASTPLFEDFRPLLQRVLQTT